MVRKFKTEGNLQLIVVRSTRKNRPISTIAVYVYHVCRQEKEIHLISALHYFVITQICYIVLVNKNMASTYLKAPLYVVVYELHVTKWL